VIHRSPFPDIEIPEVLLHELVLGRVPDLLDKPALIDGPTGRTLTYAELDSGVRRLAGGLVARSFAPGDVVAVMAPNLPEYAIVFHGVGFAGGVVTTINPSYTESEVRHQLDDAKPRILVTMAPFLETARAATVGTSVQDIYVIGDASDGAPSLTELLADPLAEPVRVPLDSPMALPYSSGTTGLAKGVVLKQPIVDRFDLSALERLSSGAAPLSAELALEVGQRLGCEVVQGYGMTELSPTSHLTPRGWGKPGSVGVSAPNTETKIIDLATGDALGVGEDGEVCVRGPQVMQGYLNNPQATADTIDRDGWLHTGDIGHIDEDGHLFVVDRLKELIKHKGFQVPPAELEGVLLTHPAVADAAVTGKPDDEAGEIPVAFVVLKEGRTETEADIAEFVASQVAHYKRPGKVTFIDAVPKSPSGKILRRVLRDQA
jgi:acyl-CoA synthetase (AMP-forming)/AMP-acid ligase II